MPGSAAVAAGGAGAGRHALYGSSASQLQCTGGSVKQSGMPAGMSPVKVAAGRRQAWKTPARRCRWHRTRSLAVRGVVVTPNVRQQEPSHRRAQRTFYKQA